MATDLLSRFNRWMPLIIPLLIGTILRIALWDNLPRPGFISDEAEYLASANWLALGRGFTWHQGWFWTRAPLYPLFLSAHLWLFGTTNLAPIFLTQSLLSLGNVALIYGITLQSGGGRRAATLAATLAALYFPFATHAQMLLSETLYLSIILGAWAVLGRWAHHQQRLWLPALAGILLGLATLTRGLTIGFLPLAALWVFMATKPALKRHPEHHTAHHPLRILLARALPAVLLVVMASGMILPWSFYASRLYGGTVLIDTTGAFNLMLGARTAYDGGRQDAPVRQFLLALLDENLSQSERLAMTANTCLVQQHDNHFLAALEQPVTTMSQGQRQHLMNAEAWCLLRAAPLAFLKKSILEFINLFQINYTSDERMSGGFTLGYLPRWYSLSLFLLNDTIYVLTLPLGVIGWAVVRRRKRAGGERGGMIAGLTGIWWFYLLLTAPLLFAIDRFRLPFLPFVFVYAAIALVMIGKMRMGQQRTRMFSIQRVRTYFSPLLVALMVCCLTLTPYAYLQPPPASLASYLGPYPSSLMATRIAWSSRAAGLDDQALIAALGNGAAAKARKLLTEGKITPHTRTYALPLLAGLEGKPAIGLALLHTRTWHPRIIGVLNGTLPPHVLRFFPPLPRNDWRAAVVQGDLLRHQGDLRGTRAAFTPSFVDDNNPVEWAWNWLHPPPTRHINLAGNTDLGYIRGFYLGEGDPSVAGTFRWSGSEARLFFPRQGRDEPQEVCMRVDGRGWPTDMALPQSRLFMGTDKEQEADESLIPIGIREMKRDVDVWCQSLPPTPDGADVVLVLRSPTFVPPAADLRNQQGPQAGQLRQLGIRLDWVELRP